MINESLYIVKSSAGHVLETSKLYSSYAYREVPVIIDAVM